MIHMRQIKHIAVQAILISFSAIFVINSVWAQPVPPVAERRITLSVTASVEVPQDWLRLTLATTREGSDATTVQAQLKQVLDAALALARSQAERGRLEARSGQFSIYPRHGRDGKVVGWQGSAQLVLEGREFERITSLAGKVQGMALQDLSFGLSPAARAALETELQAQAIARFQDKAQAVAQSFGFKAYQLVQVNVGGTDGVGAQARPMLSSAPRAMAAMADAPVPVEPGISTVQLSVNGTVRLE